MLAWEKMLVKKVIISVGDMIYKFVQWQRGCKILASRTHVMHSMLASYKGLRLRSQ